MKIVNEELKQKVSAEESELKRIIVDFVGNKLNPESNDITVENIVDIFADQFPEFLLAVAEENWISGYTQALQDLEFHKSGRRINEHKEIPHREAEDKI